MRTLKEIKEYFDREYWEKGNKSGYKDKDFDLWWNGRWCQCFNRAIPLYGKRLLDLGCGIGGFVTMCNLFGADSYGVDLSEYAIEKYKREGKRLGLTWDRCFENSCHDLSRWPNNFFDIIYSNQVFEHIPEKLIDNLIKEIYRVSRKGAVLWFALQMPEDGLHKKAKEDPDKTHVTLYGRKWWDDKFRKIGLIPAPDIDIFLRKTVTEPDHYSFFEEFNWTTLVYRKPKK